MLSSWLEQVPEPERPARFGRLLHEAVTPAGLAAEIAVDAEDAAGNPAR